ncbi:UNVERIFIED_CONTAM: hypothetical protein Scaly_3015200 [Sesamum calycinum]|uniref:Reverse transcriptase Ty1/copia-type domain-containing protein n=1 Tax=Sesamum calycinum TaxID=2727403 RepID=A0AAW2KEQ1_9LAMI
MIRPSKRFLSRGMQYSWKRVFLWIDDEMRCYLSNRVKHLNKAMQHHLNLLFPLMVFQSSIDQPENLLPERFGFIRLTSQLDNDPRTHGEVKSDIDSDNWFEAMKSEIDLMGSNLVWTIVDPPKGVKPLECKWIYKRKLGADGEVTTFKVRLVTKGYSQQPGVNFEKTYSLVAMAKSTRILLAIAWLSSPYVYGPSVYCLPSPGLSLGYGIWCRFHPGLGVYA